MTKVPTSRGHIVRGFGNVNKTAVNRFLKELVVLILPFFMVYAFFIYLLTTSHIDRNMCLAPYDGSGWLDVSEHLEPGATCTPDLLEISVFAIPISLSIVLFVTLVRVMKFVFRKVLKNIKN